MWIIFAICSAFFAGVTSILAKCGIQKTDSTVATAIRTIVVLFFSIVMVAIVGSYDTIHTIQATTWIYLVLSGLATGASWLCYFKALQLGDINKVVPIDKSSTIFTIIIAFLLFHEVITPIKIVSVILIGIGTFFMIRKKEGQYIAQKSNIKWLVYAILSAVFATLTTILGKLGINGVESNLGTAIRTSIVLIMAWIVVFVAGKADTIRKIDKKEFLFICISGLATGASWLCYYKALQDGITSIVVSIDKLSILVTILFSYIVFKETITKKALLGLLLIVSGTLLLLC